MISHFPGPRLLSHVSFVPSFQLVLRSLFFLLIVVQQRCTKDHTQAYAVFGCRPMLVSLLVLYSGKEVRVLLTCRWQRCLKDHTQPYAVFGCRPMLASLLVLHSGKEVRVLLLVDGGVVLVALLVLPLDVVVDEVLHDWVQQSRRNGFIYLFIY